MTEKNATPVLRNTYFGNTLKVMGEFNGGKPIQFVNWHIIDVLIDFPWMIFHCRYASQWRFFKEIAHQQIAKDPFLVFVEKLTNYLMKKNQTTQQVSCNKIKWTVKWIMDRAITVLTQMGFEIDKKL